MKTPPSHAKQSRAARDVASRGSASANEASTSRSGMRQQKSQSGRDERDSAYERFTEGQPSFDFGPMSAPPAPSHGLQEPWGAKPLPNSNAPERNQAELDASWQRAAHRPAELTGKGKAKQTSDHEPAQSTQAPNPKILRAVALSAVHGDLFGIKLQDRKYRDPFSPDPQQPLNTSALKAVKKAPRDEGVIFAAAKSMLTARPAYVRLVAELPELADSVLALRETGSISQLERNLDRAAAQLVRQLANGLDLRSWLFDNLTDLRNASPMAHALYRWCAIELNLPHSHLERIEAHQEVVEDELTLFSPLDAFSDIFSHLIRNMPSSRAVAAQDWGVILGLLSRAVLQSSKESQPGFDIERAAVDMLANLERDLGMPTRPEQSQISTGEITQIHAEILQQIKEWEIARLESLLQHDLLSPMQRVLVDKNFAAMFSEAADSDQSPQAIRSLAARTFEMVFPNFEQRSVEREHHQEFIELCAAISLRKSHGALDLQKVRDTFCFVVGLDAQAPRAKL